MVRTSYRIIIKYNRLKKYCSWYQNIFLPWSYDDCASTLREMGGGIGSDTVKETVGYCLQIGLFDKRLSDGWEMLASRNINNLDHHCKIKEEGSDK